MRKWPRLLPLVLEASIVLVAVYCEPTCCVRGTLDGEAFFDGRPTSWWRAELTQWQSSHYGECVVFVTAHRRPTRWEEWSERWLPKRETDLDESIRNSILGPTLVRGDPAALPVLQQLADDPSQAVRDWAQIGLEAVSRKNPQR